MANGRPREVGRRLHPGQLTRDSSKHKVRSLLQRRGNWLALAASTCWLLLTGGCASLPDTAFLSERYTVQAARLDSARGALSASSSATIVARLKRQVGDLDILDKQIALEQDIVDSPLVVGNKLTLLQDGPATYQAMFSAISKATDHINLESYIIDDDEVGQQFANLLIERQAQGVQVNVLYDSVGAYNTPRVFFDRLTQAGVNVLEFNPINPLAARKPWALNHRDHRKLLVVDGRTAFLGGINISSVYSTGSSLKGSGGPKNSAGGWRDTDVQIEGPVVAQFQKLFVQTWERQQGKPLAEKNYFPALAPQGSDIVRAIGSTPADPYSRIYLTFISAITNAEKQVYVTNAYFVPDPQLLKALLDAAKRGVDVRLVLPGHSDSATVFHAGRSHYAQLLAGGVQLYERRGALLHSKTAVIDGVWSCVGSSNLDWRSALDNDEINAVVLGRDFAQKMQAEFIKDMAASEQIDREGWERRSPLLRIKELAARLWGRLL